MNEQREQTFGYGDKQWADLSDLMRDAASARHWKEEASWLHDLIGALAARGPLRASEVALHARHRFAIGFDHATQEYVVKVQS